VLYLGVGGTWYNAAKFSKCVNRCHSSSVCSGLLVMFYSLAPVLIAN
jgi:hypothetical protein